MSDRHINEIVVGEPVLAPISKCEIGPDGSRHRG
jgi:hypothetical protein